MSSSHIVIVARNIETGEIQLPLNDMTLYGVGEVNGLVDRCRKRYSDEWVVTAYAPIGDHYAGTANKNTP